LNPSANQISFGSPQHDEYLEDTGPIFIYAFPQEIEGTTVAQVGHIQGTAIRQKMTMTIGLSALF
jgi:hypothetical protein